MTQIDYIKHLREIEGENISEIARRMKCCWSTAKKYADGSIDLRKGPTQRRKRRVMDGYEEWIEFMLEEDQRMPRDQNRTAKGIYEELVELGYQGSDRTVRDYVRRIKHRLQMARAEQFVRLEHRSGEAQVDFGRFKGINDAKVKDYYELVLTLPHSNGQVCRVLPAENSVCLLYGLQSIFQELGGTPTVIRFDNMSPVVTEIKSGTDRVLTEMFKSFQWHYRFRSEFCNPGKGNEKGAVENKVGYVRRNALTPMPVIEELEALNQELAEKMRKDRDRIHYRKGVLISELWEEDIAGLLPLPEVPFEVFRTHTKVVNKYGEIKIEGHIYRVPNVAPGSRVYVKAYWDQLEVVDKYGEELLHTCPRIYFQDAKTIDWAAELEIFIRKPRAAERGVYIKALPKSIRDYFLSIDDLAVRRGRISAMVKVLRQYPLDVAEKAAEASLKAGRTDEASLRIFAALEAGILDPEPIPLEEPWTPSEVAQWQPDLSAYDLLGVVSLR
ncbi:MAG: IS21 family transposase [Firmicutes bacterium]|nr:IS21 family transposase [Bacillota bacterium]